MSPAEVANGVQLTLFSANLYESNGDPGSIVAEALDTSADVVVFLEFTSRAERAVQAANFEERFPYRVGEARDGFHGNVIYSRFPLTDAETWISDKTPQTRATIAFANKAIRLYAVHTIAPAGFGAFRGWNANFEALRAELSREMGPVVVVGDLNLTSQHRWYGEIVDAGFSDCHRELGRGLATTWPNGTSWLPPLRLDQVFVRNKAVCLDIREGRGHGSDHRPVVTEITVLP